MFGLHMPRVSPDKDGGRIQRRCHPPSDNTHSNYQEDKIAIDRRGNRYRNPEREREREHVCVSVRTCDSSAKSPFSRP